MITSKDMKNFRVDFDKAMVDLGMKYNLGIKLSNISYTADTFNAKVSGLTVAEGMSREQTEFNNHCYKYGMKPEDYKKEVVFEGDRVQIIGFELNRRKYPILVYNLDAEKKQICTRDVVLSLKNM